MDQARANRFTQELVGKKIGKWTIEAYAGAGKSAIVFRGTDGTQTAAVKVFDPELIERFGAATQEERIRRELQLVGKSHENLVQIFDGGLCATTKLYYVVMEYLELPILADLLTEVPRERIWPLIAQVSRAARFMEDLQLCHRDIKPDNVAVSPDFQRAVLLDLGVIRPFDDNYLPITDLDQPAFIGTLQYSSPEFLFRTENADVQGWRALTFYQLGAVLHDLIMKRRLFGSFANPYARLVEAVKYETPEIVASDVAPELVLLAKNCLVKAPADRLRFVRWDDFEPPLTTTISATDVRERIRKRRLYAKQAHGTDVQAEQLARNKARTMSDFQTKIEEMIRSHCIGNDLFPPLEVQEQHNPDPELTQFAVHFPPSPDHALSSHLFIWVATSLIQELSQSIEVRCAAAVTKNGGSVTPEAERFTTIFQGVYDQAVLASIVSTVLYAILDQAQAADSDAVRDSTKWLLVGGVTE